MDEARNWARRAETLVDRGEAQNALALADRALSLAPERAEGHAARARALRALGRAGEALEALEALIRRDPLCAPAHDARGVMLAESGRMNEARLAFARALACDADFARAHFGLATLGPVSAGHLAAMEALARRPERLDAAGRLFLLYALAKGYDEAGDCERAFSAAEAGASMRRGLWRGDFEAELERLASAGPTCPLPGGKKETRPWDGERMIFVFGLPRSGTTLVEQILANHGQVFALGEIEAFERLASPDSSALSAAYIRALPQAARGARRIVDKSLGSALRIGAIRAAFPRARLIYVRRDPLDVGLSCHFTLFQHDLPFPADLEAFGRYARVHAETMAAWGKALPPDIWREVSYEALVREPEREARALMAFVGLDWRPQCLDFAGVRREIRTASLVQAREVPHARSVGRWRRYEAYLGPLKRGLAT